MFDHSLTRHFTQHSYPDSGRNSSVQPLGGVKNGTNDSDVPGMQAHML